MGDDVGEDGETPAAAAEVVGDAAVGDAAVSFGAADADINASLLLVVWGADKFVVISGPACSFIVREDASAAVGDAVVLCSAGCSRSISDVPAASAGTAFTLLLVVIVVDVDSTAGLLAAAPPPAAAEVRPSRNTGDDDAAGVVLLLGLTNALLRAANRFMPVSTASKCASAEMDGEACAVCHAGGDFAEDDGVADAPDVLVDAAGEDDLLFSMFATRCRKETKSCSARSCKMMRIKNDTGDEGRKIKTKRRCVSLYGARARKAYTHAPHQEHHTHTHKKRGAGEMEDGLRKGSHGTVLRLFLLFSVVALPSDSTSSE